jgi:hypothetical protein
MNAPAIRYPDAWSYSAYSDWALCPFKYHGKKVLKLPEPESPHLVAGNLFHQQIAAHITRPGAPAPERPIHERLQPIVQQLREHESKVVEQQWGFTKEWKPTGWFSKGAQATWLRVILDVGVVYDDASAIVGDWKTGKRYDTNDDQMELFALATFMRFPWVQQVETRLWYVDNGHEEPAEFARKDLADLQKKWAERATAMLSDRTFAARPNDKCHFCVRARQNGGDCRFG